MALSNPTLPEITDGYEAQLHHSLGHDQQLNPNAFFFEAEVDFLAEGNGLFRIELFKKFKAMGYRIRKWRLSAPQYGVPQKRERVFIVGIKSDFADALTPPRLKIKQSLGQAIWQEAFPFLTPLGKQKAEYLVSDRTIAPETWAVDTRSADDRNYDLWALRWLSRFHKGIAIDIAKYPLPAKGRSMADWTKIGFDCSNQSPIEPGDDRLSNYEEKSSDLKRTMKVPLSPAVLRKLQGLPEDWVFIGDAEDQQHGMSTAGLPIMALAVARQIHRALTGQWVDLRDAKAREITSGKNRRLRPFLPGDENEADPLEHRANNWAEYKSGRWLARFLEQNGQDPDRYDRDPTS